VVVAGVLFGVSLAVVGPDGLQAWLRILLEPESANATVNAWRMVSLKSFFDLLLPGHTGWSLALYAAVGGALVGLLLRAWSRPRQPLVELCGFTSLVAVLVDPHLVDYDLTVLVAGGVLASTAFARVRWWVVLLYPLILLRLAVPWGDASWQLSTLVMLGMTLRLAYSRLRLPHTDRPQPQHPAQQAIPAVR
jgi:hypothetical protein